MALSDVLQAGPTVKPNGLVDAWLASVTVDERNLVMQAAVDPSWTTAELHRIARAHGCEASSKTFDRWRADLRDAE